MVIVPFASCRVVIVHRRVVISFFFVTGAYYPVYLYDGLILPYLRLSTGAYLTNLSFFRLNHLLSQNHLIHVVGN